jgi:signal transduction histidine kinase
MSSKNKQLLNKPEFQAPAKKRLKSNSLRLRLMLWYGTLLTLVLVFFAVLIWKLTTDTLYQSVDSSVRAETRVTELALKSKLTITPPYWPSDQLVLQVVDIYQEPGVVVQILDNQQKVRYTSDTNNADSLPLTTTTQKAIRSGETVWYTSPIGKGHVRVEATPVYAPGGSGEQSTEQVIGTILVAKSLDDVDATLLLLRTLLLSAGILSLVGVFLGGWAIAGRVLSPLAEMTKTAGAIAVATAHGTRMGNLSTRVKRPGGHDEMAQVIDVFNEMLANLELASQSQRRFIADASHELRAPLTTIQGNLAFLKRHLDELPPAERATMLADAHSETLRLAQLVEELLLLARADASVAQNKHSTQDEQPDEQHIHEQRQAQAIELDRVVLQLIRQLRGRLQVDASQVQLEVRYIEPVRVLGDEETIRRILLILLDNAIKYTASNEQQDTNRVVVALECHGTEAVLQIHDTGIGIDPEDLPHIFERFYRADRARSRAGTGLGLAIAQTLVEQLDGRITAESTPGEGSTFSIWLPRKQ